MNACLRASAARIAKLRRLGLVSGQRLRVVTRRDAVELAARADPGLPDGLVFIPFAYREAAANLLTDLRLDPDGKIPGFKYCAARLEPMELATAGAGA